MKGNWGQVSVGALAAGLLIGNPALAQDAATQDAVSTESESAAPGDIVVTAQRRSERLERVPISVTAISSEMAANLGIRDLPDIQLVTPGLSYSTGNDYAMVYIRGVGANFSNPGVENPVGIYVDGAYVPRSLGGNLDVFDSSSVQILKGPQGTLWGRNATGGAILVKTADPTFSSEGWVTAELGNFDHRQVEAVVNVPLSDAVAVRVSGRHITDDGFITNLPDGQELGWAKRSTVRAKVLFQPDDSFRAVALVQHDTGKASSKAYQQILPNGFCLACRTNNVGFTYPLSSPYQTALNADFNNGVGNFNKGTNANLNLRYNTGIVTIESVTNYNDNVSNLAGDFDFTPANVLHLWIPSSNKTFNQSLTLSTDSGGMLDAIGGVEYLDDKNHYQIFVVPNLNPPFPSEPAARVNTKSFSAFAEVSVKPFENLKITAGGRYTRDRRTGRRVGEPDLHLTFNSFVPRFVVAYEAGQFNLYASYNEGSKAGGISSPSTPFSTFLPERLKAFEAGVKFVSNDRRLRLNAAAFHYDYNDLQTLAIDNSSSQVGNFQQAQAKVDGFELDGTWDVTDWLALNGGLTYLDARYSSFITNGENVPVYNAMGQPIDFRPGGTANLRGTQLPHAPKWTGFVGATLKGEIGNGWQARLTGLVNLSDSFFFFPNGGGPLRKDVQPSYTVARLSGSVTTPDDKLELGFFVENLTDKLTYDFIFSSAPFGAGAVPNRPRSYGLRATVRF